jgi:hypothetical protein
MNHTCKSGVRKSGVRILSVALLFYPVTAPVTANAQSAICTRTIQDIRTVESDFATRSKSYWTRRHNYVNYRFGRWNLVPDWKQRADNEKSLAIPLRQGMLGRLPGFRTLLATAKAQKCLDPSQIQAIHEARTDQVRRVAFDRFPKEEMEGGAKGTRIGQP